MSKYDIVWDINKLERETAHIQLTLKQETVCVHYEQFKSIPN